MIPWWAGAAHAATVVIAVRDERAGDPVTGASVAAGDATGVTDAAGEVTLTLPDPGPWTVTVELEGYARAELEVDASEPSARVWLTRDGSGSMEVVVEGLKPTADPSRHVVDGEMALETPGTLDDSVRLVQSLPGVTVQREYSPSSGDLSVRGSAPGDSRYYLDGVEIPYLYHYNQYASVFPATQVAQLELYPSTFSAHYGDAVGAIVEAESRLDPPEATHGGASLNFVMAGADVRAPIRGEWWFSASGRRSYQDLRGSQSAQYTVWPTFYDFAARAERGDAADGLGLFAIGAGDSYTRAAGELDLLDPLEADTVPYLAYRQGFQVVGARRQWTRPTFSGRLVGALVRHQLSGDLSGLGGEALGTTSLTSRLDLEGHPTGKLKWDAGYELIGSRTSLAIDPVGAAGVRVAEEVPALARGVAIDDAMGRLREGMYGTAHLQLGPVWLMPGLRADVDSTTPGIELQPRAAARWAIGDQGMFKVGGGRYTQRPEPADLFLGVGDPALPTTTSWQISGGWEEAIAGRLELGLDLYRKWIENPLIVPLDAPPYAAPRGDARGFELVTRYRLREVLFLWGWLAVQQTTYRDVDGLTVPGDGDQGLSGGLVFSYDIGRFTFGGRYRYASGLPFTPIEGSVYDGGNDAWLPIAGETNAERLPDYHKVDARVAYEWQLRGWSWELVAEIWYVPKASTQLYPTWNYDYTEQGWVSGPSFLPLLGVRTRF